MNNLKDVVSTTVVSGSTIAITFVDAVESGLKVLLLVLSIAYTVLKIIKERKS
tara:strand:- start:1139 stop:1297 length:159 start_codon:yes stop_codon:yes gene_type:complete